MIRQINKLSRDNETFLISRYALGKSEIDQIIKYIKKAENKFDNNWKQYE